jgi:hypothetical protein
MALEMATATLNHLDVKPPDGATTPIMVVTIEEAPDKYSALAPSLGIASDGPSAFEAAVNVKHAVVEAMAVAAEKGIKAGEQVDDAALLEFLSCHQGPDPVSSFVFVI